MNKEILKKVIDYYNDEGVCRNIFPYVVDREVFIKEMEVKPYKFEARNMIRIENLHRVPQRIIWNMEQNNLIYNFYASLSSYIRGIPFINPLRSNPDFNLEMKKKREWQQIKRFEDMIACDVLFDFDAQNKKELDKAKIQAYEFVNILKKMEITPSIRFSGFGYHVVILYKDLPDDFLDEGFNPEAKETFWRKVTKWTKPFEKKFSTLDGSLNDDSRVIKVPFSLVYNPKKDKRIFRCVLLEHESMLEFNPEMAVFLDD